MDMDEMDTVPERKVIVAAHLTIEQRIGIELAAGVLGVSRAAVIRVALAEYLVREGYMPPDLIP